MNYEMIDIIDQYTNQVSHKALKRYNDDDTISFIPIDEANSDYQAYLAAQSTPSIPEGGN